MNSKQRAFHAVVEALRGEILAGQRTPGERLPAEQTLVAQFGVSRSVVREALRVLEAQGLVEVRHGYQGGAFVATEGLGPLLAALQHSLQLGELGVRELYEARLVLEPVMARLAALRADSAVVESLREKNAEIERLVAADEDPFAANMEFHALVARAAGNRALSLPLEALFGLWETVHGRYPPLKPVTRQSVAAHAQLIDAIAAGDTEGAWQAMVEHLQTLEARFRELERADGPERA